MMMMKKMMMMIPNRSSDVDPAGSGNDVDVPPRFQRGRAPLAPTDTPKL